MNKEYCYGQDSVIVNTGATLDNRGCVDNIEDILTTENNIEIIENRIKAYEQHLIFKNVDNQTKKLMFWFWTVTVGLLTVVLGSFIGIGAGIFMTVFGMTIAFIMRKILTISKGTSKEDFEKMKNRISIYRYELEKQKQKLNELELNAKKVDVPKNGKVKKLPLTYQIDNLKYKLSIIEIFKKTPNLFVDEYNNGTIKDVLCDLGSANLVEDVELVKYLIDEYQKEQIEKENVKGKTKSKNKR